MEILAHKTREKKISFIIHKHISNFILFHKPLIHSMKFQMLIISEVLSLVQNLSNACLKCLMKLDSHPFPATSWSCNCKRINLHELNVFHICTTGCCTLYPSWTHDYWEHSLGGAPKSLAKWLFWMKKFDFLHSINFKLLRSPPPKVICLKFVICQEWPLWLPAPGIRKPSYATVD